MKKKQQFKVLDIDDRAQVTLGGEFINSIKLQKGCVMLYLVDNAYFVEVFYHSISKKIIGIELAREERLPMYTEEIDIGALLN